jgi:hypothetical protein
MKNFLKLLAKKAKRFSFVTIITFMLGMFFFMSIAPLTITGATTEDTRSPGAIYLNYSGENGVQEGFVPNIMEALLMSVVGSPSRTSNTTADGSGITYKGGAMQALSSYSEVFYDEQPASFVVWAQDQYYQIRSGVSFSAMAAQPNPNETSNYAPGIGSNVLTPIIGLWEYSRNLVYGVYIIILIVIAFLILLRRPLGGQEVITIANSLPSLVISIILVAFSYPICGVFIDVVYLGSNLAYNVLYEGNASPGKELETPVTKYDENGNKIAGEEVDIKMALQPDDPQMSIWTIMNLSGANICNRNAWTSGLTTDKINQTECSFSFIIPKQASNMLLGGVVDKVITGIGDSGLGKFATSILIELILALAMFQTALKLFLNLLNSYLTLSIYPVIAPWVFLSAAIPNNLGKTLNGFFKTLGAASLNLVVIYACFLILVLFGQSAKDNNNGMFGTGEGNHLGDAFNQAGQLQWTPPLLGYSSQQIFDANSLQNGANGGNIITSLLIFGLYMAIPNVSEMIKKFLEVASPFQAMTKSTVGDITNYGKQAAGAIGSGIGAITGNGKLFGSK